MEKRSPLKPKLAPRSKLRQDAFSHTIVFGGSGNGKTVNISEPCLHQVLASQTENGEEASVLVIDAKNEYERIVKDILGSSDRLLIIDGRKARFNPFEADAAKSLEEKLLPLYMMTEGVDPKKNGSNSSFASKAKSLMTGFLRLDQAYFDQTGCSIFFVANRLMDFCDNHFTNVSVKDMLEEIRGSYASLKAKEKATLNNPEFTLLCTSVEAYLSEGDSRQTNGYFAEFAEFIQRTHMVLDRHSGHNMAIGSLILLAERYSLEKLLHFIKTMEDMRRPRDEQWFYNTSYFEPFFTMMLGKKMNSYCDLEPFVVSESLRLIEHFDRGGVVLLKLNPEDNDDPAINYVGRFLKRILFKYTFIRKNLNRPVAYFADEAHRFITADRETGEHNYLDRCRAFNSMVFLSTQSIQSIKQALKEQTGDPQNEAVDIILNNTGTKYFFGASDPVTQDYLAKITAKSPFLGYPNVTDVRPLASLDVGTCYYFKHNGDWGIKKNNLDEIAQQNQIYRDQIREGGRLFSESNLGVMA